MLVIFFFNYLEVLLFRAGLLVRRDFRLAPETLHATAAPFPSPFPSPVVLLR